MAELNKGALTSENNNSFPNNNTGFITPTLLRTFNGNMIDSLVDEVTYNLDSASFSSSISQLKNFSSSLDNTYATDAQLNFSSSVLQANINLKVNTASTSSMTVLSSSYAVSSSFSLTASYAENAGVFNTSSLVTTASFNAYTASQTVISASFNQRIDNLDPSGSAQAIDALNLFTSSQYVSNSLFVQTSQTSSMSVLSSSYAVTASFALNVPATASFAITASYALQALTASFAENAENINVIVEDIYTGEAITKGDPLYISGSQGAKAIVYKADAAVPTKMPVTYVASETIGAGEDSRGIVLGLIEGLNLTGYVAGDSVYVAEGGGWSTSRPTGSNSITQLLGVITKGGNGGKGLVLNPGPATLPTLESGHVWIGNGTNQPTPQTLSELGLATTGSNTFIGNQIISGNLVVTGSNINLEVDPPALGSVGTTNIKTVLDTTASAIVTSLDLTRQAAGPTGDLTAIRLQTFSGSSDTTGDRVLSRITTGVNRHTSLGLSGSVVNTQVNAVWATGSSAFTSQIVETAQSGSATLSINVGNLASNNVAGTASIAAGLIRIGTNASHTISTTGSFGPLVIAGTVANPAISVRSGSVEITTPQGSGSFYSNVPITSSGLRINGDGRFSGIEVIALGGANGSGSLFVQNAVTASSISASVIAASQYIGLPSGIISASSQISNLGYAITGSNTFVENQTINAQLIVSSAVERSFINGGLLLQGDNAGNALVVYSGSVAVNTPQGQGFFYSNLPITSSAGRFNGQSFIKRLNIEDNGGNAHLQVENNASVSGSFTSVGAITGSVISASQYIGFIQSASIAQTASFLTPNQTLSGATTLSGSVNITGSAPTQQWVSGGLTLSGSLISNVTDIYTGSNNANFIVTLGSASMASLIQAGTTNLNTLYFVI
jgi:hypothetical protein